MHFGIDVRVPEASEKLRTHITFASECVVLYIAAIDRQRRLLSSEQSGDVATLQVDCINVCQPLIKRLRVVLLGLAHPRTYYFALYKCAY